MATPTDAERLTALEQLVTWLTGRVEALEAQREGQAATPALASSDVNYLATELLGAVAGSKDAETLNHFQ